jgi:hypothetical protein
VLSSTSTSSSVLFGRRSAALEAVTVETSGVLPDPELEPEPLPVVLVPKNTGASSGIEPDAESLIVWPAAGVPLTVAENLLSGITRSR